MKISYVNLPLQYKIERKELLSLIDKIGIADHEFISLTFFLLDKLSIPKTSFPIDSCLSVSGHPIYPSIPRIKIFIRSFNKVLKFWSYKGS